MQPDFSHKRGFYTSSFNVTLSSLNGNCDIYFTTDGTRPTTASGSKYTTPVTINKTTVLSAVAIDKTFLSRSDIVTQTYLFIDSIMAQPNDPQGYPAEWGSEYPEDYEIDPEIASLRRKSEMEKALKSLPTISLVTNASHLFSHDYTDSTGGIYIYTQKFLKHGNVRFQWNTLIQHKIKVFRLIADYVCMEEIAESREIVLNMVSEYHFAVNTAPPN